MIVMSGFERLTGIVHDVVFESDAALLGAVFEFEIVKSTKLCGGFFLHSFPGFKPLLNFRSRSERNMDFVRGQELGACVALWRCGGRVQFRGKRDRAEGNQDREPCTD